MNDLTFFYRITPKAKQSFRMGKRHGYQPKALNEFRDNIIKHTKEQIQRYYKILDQALSVEVWFIYELPHRASAVDKRAVKDGILLDKITRPDIDNLQKSIFDAFNNVLWCDDASVSRAYVYKFWGKANGIKVVIRQPREIMRFPTELEEK